MSNQHNVQYYRDREAAQRALAERTVEPAARARILELADAYAAVAATQQALADFGHQQHQHSKVDATFGPQA